MKRIRTTIRFFSIALSVFFLVLIISAVAFYFFFPKDQLLKIIVSQIENQINLKISAEKLDFSLSGVGLNNLSIFDSDRNHLILKVKNARLSFSLDKITENKLELKSLNLINPEFIIDYQDGRYNFQDFSDTNKTTHSNMSSGEIQINYPEVFITEGKVIVRNTHDRLKPLIGEFTVSSHIIIGKDNNVNFNNIFITLPADRGNILGSAKLSIEKDNFKFVSDLNTEKVDISWVYDFDLSKKLKLPFNTFTGTVNNFTITKEGINAEAKGSSILTDGKSAYADGSFSIDFVQKMLKLENINGTIEKDSALINLISIDFTKRNLFINLKNIDSNISNFRYFVPIPDKLYGRVKGSLSTTGYRTNADLTLINTGWDFDKKILTDINHRITIDNNNFKAEDIKFNLYGSPSKLSISATGSKFQNFVAYIYIDKVDATKHVKDNVNPNVSGIPKSIKIPTPISITGKIYIDDIAFENYNLKNSFIAYSLNDYKFQLNQIITYFFNAKITGTGGIDLSKNDPVAGIDIRFNDIKIENILMNQPKLKNRFYGPASGSINLQIPVFGGISRIKGTTEFIINNGKLANTGIQDALGTILEPLKYKLKDLEFNRIYGNLSLEENNYKINSFVFNAQNIRLSLSGLIDNTLAGDLNIKLEFNENFIQDLPNPTFLYFSKYKEGLWYTIPLEAEGKDLSNPDNYKRLK
ncbi:MAG: hypothetical protein JW982_05695 [Spirochaetes bacterium]|nr:hypothetical protein [Spirochaetota bacterium]